MSSEAPYSEIERVLRTAIPVLAKKRGVSFTRQISVQDRGGGGDYRVSEDRVIVNPLFATEGDIVAHCNRIIDACNAFDRRLQEEQRRIVDNYLTMLRDSIRGLKRLGFSEDGIRATISSALKSTE